MKKTITCTVCPNGCEITAQYTNENDIVLEGYKCKRGIEYAKDECFDPKRTFTSSVKISGCARRMLPVRSSKPISKALLMKAAQTVHDMNVSSPVTCNQVLCENFAGTDADLIASMTLERND